MKNKKRICPDCQAREVEKNCIYCSECREVNRYLYQAKYQSGYRRKSRREYWQAYYLKNKGKLPDNIFNQRATEEQIKYFS